MVLKQIKQEVEGGGSHASILPLVISVLLVMSLGLFLVWLNIERTKIAYNLQSLQSELDSRTELQSKLLVERDHLLSPHVLGAKASAMGLQIAKPGQIRRMDGKDAQGKGTQGAAKQ